MSCCCNSTSNYRAFTSTTGCCNTVQPSPSPCCEVHGVVTCPDICFHVTANTIATADTFYLTFQNTCGSDIPLNTNDVFFYHASAGLIRILTLVNGTYSVELVDESNAGVSILTTDCVMVTVQQNAGGSLPALSRCLYGSFLTPALNASATISIYNGAGIPIGSTISFTYQGETRSYVVSAYLTATNNIYSYTVTNTGNGGTPGVQILGDCDGGCSIPINVITDVDVCNLSETNNIDNLTGCLNGAPRAFVPTGEGDVPYGTADGKWELRKILNTTCCVVIDDCLKFSGAICPSGQDEVLLRDTNLECFEEAFNAAVDAGNHLPMVVDGSLNVVAIGYNPSTHVITLVPADPTALEEQLSFPAGTEVCIGECCTLCTNGPQHTNVQSITQTIPPSSLITVGIVDLPITFPNGTSHWLIGIDHATGAQEVLQCDAAYFANPELNLLGLPRITDPLMFRQKICNTHPYGCDQECKLDFNFEGYFSPIADDVRIEWEIGHFAMDSETLADNTTPNPFNYVSVQAKTAGTLLGASAEYAMVETSSLMTGNRTNTKVLPFFANNLRDYAPARKCSCFMSIVWFFATIHCTTGATTNVTCTIRRRIEKGNWNYIPYPLNATNAEGFNR